VPVSVTEFLVQLTNVGLSPRILQGISLEEESWIHFDGFRWSE